MKGAEGKGQLLLDGLGQPPVIEVGTQYSFAHIAQPQLWGVEPRELGPQDHEDMALMAPDVLRQRLLPPDYGFPSTRHYRNENGFMVHVALTPQEYGLVVGSVRHLGERAVNQTLSSRRHQPNTEGRESAAQRAGGHILKSYIEKMDKYTSNVLEEDIRLLKKFQEYVTNPQLRRMRGDNFRVNLGWLRGHIFEDMFTALGRQRNWNDEQGQRARRALDSRLFLDRGNNRHLSNWKEMLDFELDYTSHKWALFKTKTQEAKQYSKRHYEQDRL